MIRKQALPCTVVGGTIIIPFGITIKFSPGREIKNVEWSKRHSQFLRLWSLRLGNESMRN